MRPDPEVVAHNARQAAQHQRAVVPGLSDERLHVVAERLARDVDMGATESAARLAVVAEELRRRENASGGVGEDAAAR